MESQDWAKSALMTMNCTFMQNCFISQSDTQHHISTRNGGKHAPRCVYGRIFEGGKHPTPDPAPEKVPVGFIPKSENAAVKSTSKAVSPLSTDFGVWGIARHSDAAIHPYLLWDASLERVTKNGQYYQPVNPAFWISGYTYNFLALAPYSEELAGIVTPVRAAGNAKDKLTFTYDLASKYSGQTPDYAFDLLGAAATSTVDANHDRGALEITFWHLFAQINLKVSFVDANGTPAEGTVHKMSLRNIDTDATYTISLGNDNSLDVGCVSGTLNPQTVELNGATGTVHIIPQQITGFELYLDYTRDNVSYQDFKINLNVSGNQTYYGSNESYNWNIVISPKEDISFKVEVAEWESDAVSGGGLDPDGDNYIDII